MHGHRDRRSNGGRLDDFVEVRTRPERQFRWPGPVRKVFRTQERLRDGSLIVIFK